VATDHSNATSTPAATTLSVAIPAVTGALLAWNVAGQNNYGAQNLSATTVGSSVVNSLGLTRGGGVATSGSAAANAWGGRGWSTSTASAGITSSDLISFGFTVSAGQSVSLSSIGMNYRRGGSGPSDGYWQFQINGGAWTVIGAFANQFSSGSTSGAAMAALDLAGVSALQNLAPGARVNIRLIPYGAGNSTSSWYVYDRAGNDLVLNGFSIPLSAPTTTTLAAPSGASVTGQSVTFSATVAALAPGSGVPTGNVIFRAGGVDIGVAPLSGGVATLSLATLGVGSHDITAVYGGGGNFTASTSSAATHIVNQATTSTALRATPNVTTGGDLATFTATVSAVAPGGGIPPGGVSFFDGVTLIATATIDAAGTATFTTSTLAVGAHEITAIFGGAAGYAGSLSSPVVFVVADNAPPRVLGVVVNGDNSALAGPQRSRVASLTVTFDRAVHLDDGAIALALHVNNVRVDGAEQTAGFGRLPSALNLATADNVTWVVTFAGNTDNGLDGLSSLKDGVYDLNIAGAKVHPKDALSVAMAADWTTTFHRLFGDVGAPATPSGGTPGTDFLAAVNTGDNLAFRAAFNNPAAYTPHLDANGDGAISTGDNLQFRNRFNRSVSWTIQ
jgi:hypothetical protein